LSPLNHDQEQDKKENYLDKRVGDGLDAPEGERCSNDHEYQDELDQLFHTCGGRRSLSEILSHYGRSVLSQ